jgi:hypothetical protein
VHLNKVPPIQHQENHLGIKNGARQGCAVFPHNPTPYKTTAKPVNRPLCDKKQLSGMHSSEKLRLVFGS